MSLKNPSTCAALIGLLVSATALAGLPPGTGMSLAARYGAPAQQPGAIKVSGGVYVIPPVPAWPANPRGCLTIPSFRPGCGGTVLPIAVLPPRTLPHPRPDDGHGTHRSAPASATTSG